MIALRLTSICALLYDSSDIDVCGLLGSPSGELEPAVISPIGSGTGDYYENTYPRRDSLLTDVHRSYSFALLHPACPRFHHDAAASRVQRRGKRKRSL